MGRAQTLVARPIFVTLGAMHKTLLCLVLVAWAGLAHAAERTFDFSELAINDSPTGCVSVVAGTGKPGVWKIVADEVALPGRSAGGNAPAVAKQSVVAQTAEDFTDEHFPMLILGDDTYGDFKLTTRFKIVSGIVEQMAGIAFRVQDERNYYVVRVSALGNNFRFYKVVNGERGPLLGGTISVAPKTWHEITVECRGNQIHCALDGNTNIIPTLTDNSFSSGRIAYWTKSDSVSYFTGTHIEYTPREPMVQSLVREAMVSYPRLLGLQVFMLMGQPPEPKLVASNDEKEIGTPGRKSDADVIRTGTIYLDKQRDTVTVFMPLRDRNGDAAASVRVKMKAFPGQTEENAIARAMPVIKQMQEHAPASADWTE